MEEGKGITFLETIFQVFDCRLVTTTGGMFEALCNHIKYATNRGNLR